MTLSRKAKSDLIFWGVIVLFTGFLFFTPYGKNTRDWLTSFALSTPSNTLNNEGSKINSNWILESTSGESLQLKELKKTLFINIWATWCSPCRSELPSVLALQEQFKDKVLFLLISPSESLVALEQFKTAHSYQTEFYTSDYGLPKELETQSYPTTFIIDKDKRIILKSVGAHNWNSENIHKILNQLTAE